MSNAPLPICVAGAALLLSACATPPATDAQIAGAAQAGAPRALYDAYPDRLLRAAAASCDDPGETLLVQTEREVTCTALMPPEATAAIILGLGGTVEALPESVTSLYAQPTPEGPWLVTVDAYLTVPQDGGGLALVRPEDPDVSRSVEGLFRVSGGRPIP
ncbi:MAG: hypothetical protein ACU0BF_04975 [Paracoccaceae bacterium]